VSLVSVFAPILASSNIRKDINFCSSVDLRLKISGGQRTDRGSSPSLLSPYPPPQLEIQLSLASSSTKNSKSFLNPGHIAPYNANLSLKSSLSIAKSPIAGLQAKVRTPTNIFKNQTADFNVIPCLLLITFLAVLLLCRD